MPDMYSSHREPNDRNYQQFQQGMNTGPVQQEEEGDEDKDEEESLGNRPGGHSQGWGIDESDEEDHQIDEQSPDEGERIAEQALQGSIWWSVGPLTGAIVALTATPGPGGGGGGPGIDPLFLLDDVCGLFSPLLWAFQWVPDHWLWEVRLGILTISRSASLYWTGRDVPRRENE
ncbi:hypothetical protein C8J57DRAFT_1620080 [Mycena rebaudengoi]|nr:hypothetical protein C8J57DRAFT_1620080 [Mycena rebaudengoi]